VNPKLGVMVGALAGSRGGARWSYCAAYRFRLVFEDDAGAGESWADARLGVTPESANSEAEGGEGMWPSCYGYVSAGGSRPSTTIHQACTGLRVWLGARKHSAWFNRNLAQTPGTSSSWETEQDHPCACGGKAERLPELHKKEVKDGGRHQQETIWLV